MIQKPIVFIFLVISYLMNIHLPLLNLLPPCLGPEPLKFIFSLNRADPQSSTSKPSPYWPCLCLYWSCFVPKCSIGNTLNYNLLLHLLIIYFGLLLRLIHHLHSWGQAAQPLPLDLAASLALHPMQTYSLIIHSKPTQFTKGTVRYSPSHALNATVSDLVETTCFTQASRFPE